MDGESNYVRVQVLTNGGALDRDKQLAVVAQFTDVVTKAAGDPSYAQRVWVLLTEAVDGGSGLWGHAHTNNRIGRRRTRSDRRTHREEDFRLRGEPCHGPGPPSPLPVHPHRADAQLLARRLFQSAGQSLNSTTALELAELVERIAQQDDLSVVVFTAHRRSWIAEKPWRSGPKGRATIELRSATTVTLARADRCRSEPERSGFRMAIRFNRGANKR